MVEQAVRKKSSLGSISEIVKYRKFVFGRFID